MIDLCTDCRRKHLGLASHHKLALGRNRIVRCRVREREHPDMGSFRGVAAASIDWIATIRGRLGLLVQPNLLVYGTAGLAIVNAEAHANVAAFGIGQISARESDTETGVVFGVGVENKVTENVGAP